MWCFGNFVSLTGLQISGARRLCFGHFLQLEDVQVLRFTIIDRRKGGRLLCFDVVQQSLAFVLEAQLRDYSPWWWQVAGQGRVAATLSISSLHALAPSLAFRGESNAHLSGESRHWSPQF